MESRGCKSVLKKTASFAQIAVLAQLPQIPDFISSTKPLWNYMINVHWAFSLATCLTASISL